MCFRTRFQYPKKIHCIESLDFLLKPTFPGGVHNAFENAAEMKATSFALFVKQQRQWKSKPLEDDIIKKFKAAREVRTHEDLAVSSEIIMLLLLGFWHLC